MIVVANLLLASLCWTLAAAATHQRMFGFTNEKLSRMLIVDDQTPSSSNTQVIGTVPLVGGVGGAAWNPKDSKLYAMLRCAQATKPIGCDQARQNMLVTLDPTSGEILENFGKCQGPTFGDGYNQVIGNLEIDLDGKLFGTTGCSAYNGFEYRVIFIEIVNGQCTYTLGPDLSSAPSWGNPCLNGLAVNDQNEMFISAPGSGPFNIYQVNKTTGAIIKFVGAIPNPVPTSMGNVMLNWVNRLKFNPNVPNQAWVWVYPFNGGPGGVDPVNGFLTFTLTSSGGPSDFAFYDIDYPYDSEAQRDTRINAFLFERPQVTSCVSVADGAPCTDGRATTDLDTCIGGVCVSCPEPKTCNGVDQLSITLSDGTLVCGSVQRNTGCSPASLPRLTGWSGASTLTNTAGGSVALSDYTGCFTTTSVNATRVLTFSDGKQIVLATGNSCFVRFVEQTTAKRNALQAPPPGVVIGGAFLFPALAAAVGDPHIAGPRGEHFDFQGEAGRVYTMVANRKYFVNARMSIDGQQGGARFITHVYVTIGDVTLSTDSLALTHGAWLAPLNAQLAPLRAKATLLAQRHNGIVPLPPQLLIDVCDGERITITAVTPSAQQVAQLGLFETTHYYNVELDVAGCHDDFDGVIGQLYKCQYDEQPFVYDAVAAEKRFRVNNVHSSPRVFREDADCLALQASGRAVVGNASFK